MFVIACGWQRRFKSPFIAACAASAVAFTPLGPAPAYAQAPASPETPRPDRGFRDWFAQLPAPTPGKGQYTARAQELMADIQSRYWDEKTSRYVKEPGSDEPEMAWGAGIMYSALVGATRHDPSQYSPLLAKTFVGLDSYWDRLSKIPGYEPAPTAGAGNDKYYDDNAWLALTFLEAYELTRSPELLKRASDTLDFVLSG